jgi:hypothetical protein
MVVTCRVCVVIIPGCACRPDCAVMGMLQAAWQLKMLQYVTVDGSRHSSPISPLFICTSSCSGLSVWCAAPLNGSLAAHCFCWDHLQTRRLFTLTGLQTGRADVEYPKCYRFFFGDRVRWSASHTLYRGPTCVLDLLTGDACSLGWVS